MTRGVREMRFELGKRWRPRLNATIRKLEKKDPTIKLNIKENPPTIFHIIMDSDHQEFIQLDANLRNLVSGKIKKIYHS